MLTEAGIRRFSRHILLREIGGAGQERLLAACVRLITLDEGMRACALWCARAGVGAFALPDDDSPCPKEDPSGLLHAADAGRPMRAAVRERLLEHFPDLAFDRPPTHVATIGFAEGALSLVRKIALDQKVE